MPFRENCMQERVKSFWKYASGINKVANIEDVFIHWAALNNLTIADVSEVWHYVNDDIEKAFNYRLSAEMKLPDGTVITFDSGPNEEMGDLGDTSPLGPPAGIGNKIPELSNSPMNDLKLPSDQKAIEPTVIPQKTNTPQLPVMPPQGETPNPSAMPEGNPMPVMKKEPMTSILGQ